MTAGTTGLSQKSLPSPGISGDDRKLSAAKQPTSEHTTPPEGSTLSSTVKSPAQRGNAIAGAAGADDSLTREAASYANNIEKGNTFIKEIIDPLFLSLLKKQPHQATHYQRNNKIARRLLSHCSIDTERTWEVAFFTLLMQDTSGEITTIAEDLLPLFERGGWIPFFRCLREEAGSTAKLREIVNAFKQIVGVTPPTFWQNMFWGITFGFYRPETTLLRRLDHLNYIPPYNFGGREWLTLYPHSWTPLEIPDDESELKTAQRKAYQKAPPHLLHVVEGRFLAIETEERTFVREAKHSKQRLMTFYQLLSHYKSGLGLRSEQTQERFFQTVNDNWQKSLDQLTQIFEKGGWKPFFEFASTQNSTYYQPSTLRTIIEEFHNDILSNKSFHPQGSIPPYDQSDKIVLSEPPVGLVTGGAASKTREAANPKIPGFAFGKVDWEKYFGPIGKEPTIPKTILQDLNKPCPLWPEKKVKDTHLLVLIPQTVDGKPLTLNLLESLIKKPKGGGHTAKYSSYGYTIKKELGDAPAPASHWVLMTTDRLPYSRNYDDQHTFLSDLKEKTGSTYELPIALEAATAILMHHVKTGGRFYGEIARVRCQEKIEENRYPVAISHGPNGISYGYIFGDLSYNTEPVLRKF